METKYIIPIEELNNHYKAINIFLQMFLNKNITGKELFNIFKWKLKRYIRKNFNFEIKELLTIHRSKSLVLINSKLKHALFGFGFRDWYQRDENRWLAIFDLLFSKKIVIEYYFENHTDISDTIPMKLLFNNYAYYEGLCAIFIFRGLQNSFKESLLRQRFGESDNMRDIIISNYKEIFSVSRWTSSQIKLNEEKNKITYHPNYERNFNKDIPLKEYDIHIPSLYEFESTADFLNNITNQVNTMIHNVIEDFMNVDDVLGKMFELSIENNNN